ncbi:actin-binding LIM protein 3-like [Sycon ciliatum]|uniref:actin-binding LIM protein 3-like n=1 Tax=Sycon ciliatum TaxID=27933 RepID=UPI0031F6CBA8
MDHIHCRNCEKRCFGEALRVQDYHFHPTCFVCTSCNVQLAEQGFYIHQDKFYCSKDYLERFGTRCHTCNDFVEGDVISALGNTYHQHCFVCASCRQPFPLGEQVTQVGDECFCEKCLAARDAETAARLCPECKDIVEMGQGLLAVDKVWHVWCFRCKICHIDLTSKYIVKDNDVLCEDDFNKQFGIQCELCHAYIAGKVVQAGDSFFHADCSKCVECGKAVGEDIDVFVLGSQVWHSECYSGSQHSNQQKDATESGDVNQGDVIVKSPLPRLLVEDSEPITIEPALDSRNVSASLSAVPATAAGSVASAQAGLAIVSPQSSLNESPEKRPDSQDSTGGDSAISCTTPTGTSSEAEASEVSVAANAHMPNSGVQSIDHHGREDKENELSADHLLGLSDPPSRAPSEASSVFANGEHDSYPSTPTPTPSVVQRTPSTSSAGSGSRIRPKSIAAVPMRSGSSRSSSSSSFNWKEMYPVDDKEEVPEQPLPKACATVKSLAHGVVSPSTGADRFLRRDSRPGSQASVASAEKAASPTSPPPHSLNNRHASKPSEGQSEHPPPTPSSPLSLIEEAESSSPQTPHKETQGAASQPAASTQGRRDKATYPLEKLQLSDTDVLLPKGVERSRLEEYLDDSDFEKALGMNRPTFYKLQVWKQRELKRKAKLF